MQDGERMVIGVTRGKLHPKITRSTARVEQEQRSFAF
jgi:hypothetical protein